MGTVPFPGAHITLIVNICTARLFARWPPTQLHKPKPFFHSLPPSGAPHNIDETWALYVGEDKACGLYEQGFKRSIDFGTMESCTAGKANSQALAAHQKMYQASMAGDMERFEAARQEMEEAFLITYLQATLKYAKSVDDDLAAGKDPAEHQVRQPNC
jgi:hypothetical protein